MNLLLDTQVLLWWLSDDPALSAQARAAIASPDNGVYVSAASIWEIVIKQSIGKIDVPSDLGLVLASEPFHPLPITAAHAFQVRSLPALHKDPFDRILAAQCIVEEMVLVSADRNLKQYPIKLLAA